MFDLSELRALPLPLLYVGATAIFLLAIATLRLISNSLPTKAPPIFEGLPFIGGIMKFASGPMKLMADGYEKYGEVFTVPVLHKQFTFLLGPHVSGHFFKANDDEMSQKEVYEFNVPTFGKGVVFDVDHKVRAEQFKFFAEALKSAKLKLYVPYFVQEAQDYFAKWGDEGEVDFAKTFSELIILTASRTLMGREVRESMFNQVADLFHDLDMGMLPISVIFPYLPIPAHWNRDRARKELASIFSRIIQARRGSDSKEDDMLQSFIDSRYEKVYGGRYLNDEEITGMLIATLFAGQHTSSITSSWTGLTMIRDKAAWAAAEEEQRAVVRARGEELSIDALNDMEVLGRNMTEALRLFPPLIMLLRAAKAPFAVTTSTGKTHVIPKGHVVATSPAFAHRLPHVFRNPDDFEPERFVAPREEDKAAPFSFIGFGGGRHGCMGSNFAILQIKSIWSVLLRNFDFELVDPFPEQDFESMVVGPKPCRVRYRRRKLTL
ncbi:sterol 14 desaturase [Coccomyxa subellipsoidea C-169]|uniref:Sterol 14 desaturase n=1 Tax=Coccomyxa subellipsoidea (strain C-169) TaxID=574566 RepID=I0YT23_COCSC|nr:sterol 14 desaturase [Coccomyxa subellipsoidea C-169]EIE21542.1 sterol 14 desaturase [Coccomyxa subellipsoidea C-169]|eukprot:XP_005646086.1 sterol 14 desaturase [Coccomyxa subellipsoidea C-169]